MKLINVRRDGDLPLPGADVERLQKIVTAQQSILRSSLNTSNLDTVPQMWAMYKEVMSYFASGLEVPDNVTPLLSDDNWGNLMAVMPDGKHKAGGGIYYHADYVGDPRNYKWLNTVSLAKSKWQLSGDRKGSADPVPQCGSSSTSPEHSTPRISGS